MREERIRSWKPELLSWRRAERRDFEPHSRVDGRKQRFGIPGGDRQRSGAPCADPVWIYNERNHGLSRCERKETAGREKLIQSLTELEGMTSITLSVNRERTNVIMGKEIRCLWGQEFITDYIGKVKYQISPLSFYQVNPVQTEKLYSLALEYAGLTGEETVWDLYCGIGTISLFLAQKAKKFTAWRSCRRPSQMRKQCENQWNRKCRVFVGNPRKYCRNITKICQRTSRRTCACRCDCSRSAAERMRGKSAPHHGRYAAGSDCVCLVRFCDTGKGSEDSSGAGV